MRERHWIGRCIGESRVSDSVWGLTLTYGGGDTSPKSAYADYTDIQKFHKRLRKDGYVFRYIVVGEYGDEKGRVHWHGIYFWKTAPPTYPDREKDGKRIQDWKYWGRQIEGDTLGHVVIDDDKSDGQAAKLCRYLWKYVNKTADNMQVRLRMSKNPAIGLQYCLQYVDDHVAQQLPLFAAGPFYTIDGVRVKKGPRKGTHWRYYVSTSGSLFRDMAVRYRTEWQLKTGREIPYVECLHDFFQKYDAENYTPLSDDFDTMLETSRQVDLERRYNHRLAQGGREAPADYKPTLGRA